MPRTRASSTRRITSPAIAPHTRSERLDVRHAGPHAGLAGDGDHLVDRRHEPDRVVGLVPYVARVDAAVCGHHLAELDHLLDVGVAAGRIEKPGREPERSLLHRLARERPHPVELLGGRRPVILADDGATDRPVAGQLRDVDPQTVPQQGITLRGQIHRPATVRVDEHGGDALGEQRVRPTQRLGGEPACRMRVRIDETGRHPRPIGIDDAARARAVDEADGGDAAIADRHVGAIPRVPGAVDDEAVGDHERVGLLSQRRGDREPRAARSRTGAARFA